VTAHARADIRVASLVSIVIPAYNHAAHLDHAIRSVLAQDYPSVELIVLDDGSTDGTRGVLEKYTGRFHWETHANMGQAATLNKGWARAHGEFLSYLSADDLLLPHAVSTAVEALAREPALVMVYGDFDMIDAEGRTIRTVRAPDWSYYDLVVRTVCAPGPGVFFRRSAHEAAGGWDPAFRQWPDYEYWLRLGLQGPFARIPRVLAAFRVHGASQTFSRLAFDRAEEPVRALFGFYSSRARLPPEIAAAKPRALAGAYLASAQLHFRAARPRVAFSRLAAAARLDWRAALSRRALWMCVHGLLARPAMRLRLAVTARLRRALS
jgi:glycosyltransferase involved in cell wall biosynthesis